MSNPATSPKRFLPQPIETTSKSSKASPRGPTRAVISDSDAATPTISVPASDGVRPARKFRPEPVETSTRSSKTRPAPAVAEDTDCETWHRPREGPSGTTPPRTPRRRFTPELIETSQRSRKSREPTLAPPIEGEQQQQQQLHARSPRELVDSVQRRREAGLSFRPTSPDPNGVAVHHESLLEHGLLRSTSPRRPAAARQHSFQVPSLDPIESSESDESKCPSLSTSPSVPSEDNALLSKRAKKMRESCDDSYSGYLLGLAAKAAEKQLREQAMAAYPNSDFHEPVHHFAIDRESDPSDEEGEEDFMPLSHEIMTARPKRESMIDLAWEVQEMRKHHEKLGLQRKPSATKPAYGPAREQRRSRDSFSNALHITRQGLVGLDGHGQPKHTIGLQEGVGLQAMRNAASPPMLGRDLKFRKCQSPQVTMLQVDFQWRAKPAVPPPPEHCGKGLWRGLCVADGRETKMPEQRPFGIKTPNRSMDVAIPDPAASSGPHVPPESADRSCGAAADDDDEYASQVTDEFVSQVYNYLSLGYPSVARKFDDELSKISRIPAEELRHDDGHANAKGFVGLEEGVGITLQAAIEGKCARWLALRIYIKEWMRQHPDLSAGHLGPDAWGFTARRGSWAI